MATYAVVESGVVVNVIEWDGKDESWTPPAGAEVVAVPDGVNAGIHWTYADGTFTFPPNA